jgi:hypothetical protein
MDRIDGTRRELFTHRTLLTHALSIPDETTGLVIRMRSATTGLNCLRLRR